MPARKTKKRVTIITSVAKDLSSRKIFWVADPESWDELQVQTYMHSQLIHDLQRLFHRLFPGQYPATIEKKARKAIIWSSVEDNTIHNQVVLGVSHRPDFVFEVDGMRIAVEVKLGRNGSSVREGIGQCIMYAMAFDFVIYLLADATRGRVIRESLKNEPEKNLKDRLWDQFNIWFEVV